MKTSTLLLLAAAAGAAYWWYQRTKASPNPVTLEFGTAVIQK